jgi:hypothetical protein
LTVKRAKKARAESARTGFANSGVEEGLRGTAPSEAACCALAT